MSKYNSMKIDKYGRIWDSTMECDFYTYLLEQKEAGLILEIECQPVYLLQEGFLYKGKNIRKIEYRSDFRVTYSDGSQIVWDVKGQVLNDFKLKFKMVKYKYPDVDFRCVRSQGRKPNKIWIEI